jgi:hypothetical protein
LVVLAFFAWAELSRDNKLIIATIKIAVSVFVTVSMAKD